MLIKSKKGWEIPEREATPQEIFFNRRRFLKTTGLVLASAASMGLGACDGEAEESAAGAASSSSVVAVRVTDVSARSPLRMMVRTEITWPRFTSRTKLLI